MLTGWVSNTSSRWLRRPLDTKFCLLCSWRTQQLSKQSRDSDTNALSDVRRPDRSTCSYTNRRNQRMSIIALFLAMSPYLLQQMCLKSVRVQRVGISVEEIRHGPNGIQLDDAVSDAAALDQCLVTSILSSQDPFGKTLGTLRRNLCTARSRWLKIDGSVILSVQERSQGLQGNQHRMVASSFWDRDVVQIHALVSDEERTRTWKGELA